MLEYVISGLLIVGALFVLLGSFALVKLPDFIPDCTALPRRPL